MLRRIIDSLINRNKDARNDSNQVPENTSSEPLGVSEKPRTSGKRRRRHPSTKMGPKAESEGRQTAKPDRAKPSPKSKWYISQFNVPPEKGKVRFHDLSLPVEIMHAISDLGFEYCTPIQSEILPHTLSGTDASGRAQTGTGKTAAFLITIFSHFKKNPIKETRANGTPRALIMVPTRELAIQVQKDAHALSKYLQNRTLAIFGGMDYRKQQQLLTEKVVDTVVATPGRLLDFKNRGDIHLDRVEILVIDEADQMLDMGFMPDMRQIIRSTPPKTKRQTLFFGATLTPEITRLASQWTRNSVTVDIDPEQVAVDSVNQLVYLITSKERFKLLYNLITQQNLERVIVFCNRRDTTKKLADRLRSYDINCSILSGDVDQRKRVRTLEAFRSGNIRVLVATDVAGRGIHVEGISHVVNYNIPLDPEDYVHRIGRTGRAGASGTSISFATEDESFYLPAIEKFLGEKITCIYPSDSLLIKLPPAPPEDDTTIEPRSHSPSSRRRRSNSKKKFTRKKNSEPTN